MREPGTRRDARGSVCLGRSLRMPSVVPGSPPGPLRGGAGRAWAPVHRLNHLLESHEGRQEDQHARASIRGRATQ
jgi:hypothetical protein